ncbi:MAG: tRNA pseudouridine(55) synthase TruB [Armatimonadota bacterium]|nr:tRNA pseudouridine(55) synthase TruB [Armatimonadota bacterium]MDR7426854.1 tRNA pseudouridine(55) synthase TruB [Armatimonadota bacterium]MDR7464647.1 tRNA pseudouridine(55) synthase TruB [Armatimonadota bacterium]MDR7468801.1 tRNA pseudouridine(55) synthase TruB [Armatimonadota bacterium]MDR7473678.1 tRNA pseudouridine(55) synthase TruB [Armatimonadota bacterium]
MDGVLNVLKPTGMTSHDVVDAVRRLVGQRRVGHTGTLDPGAAGVLVLVLGRATRIAEFLTEADKAYRFEVTFGVATATGDAFGEVTSTADASGLSEEELADLLPQFLGEIDQLPPMTSAVKVGGVPLYRRAHRGEAVAVRPRRVRISRLRLLRFWPGARPRALLEVECGKGTYVRALARDIGEMAGVGAYASFMLRLRVGRFSLGASRTLEELSGLQAEGRLEEALLSMDDALADLPAVQLLPAQRLSVLDGLPLPLFRVPNWQRLPRDAPIRLRDQSGLVALARVEGGSLRPFKVLRGR